MSRSGGKSRPSLEEAETQEALILRALRGLLRRSPRQTRFVGRGGVPLRAGERVEGEDRARTRDFYVIDSTKVEEILGGAP